LSTAWRIASAAGAASILATVATSLTAYAFHGYATGFENDTSKQPFTAVIATRVDEAISGIPNDGCSGPIQGSPVYQPEWVVDTSNSQDWEELGSGSQCQDKLHYWYWGYGYQGNFHLMGTRNNTLGQSHRFYLIRTVNAEWSVDVDSTQIARFQWNETGIFVEAGLESYASGASVTEFSNSSLQYEKNFGAPGYWDGFDGQIVNSSMCGYWYVAPTWYSGEGTGC
jgi:hypothetical protein